MQCEQKCNVFTQDVTGDNAYYSLYIEGEREGEREGLVCSRGGEEARGRRRGRCYLAKKERGKLTTDTAHWLGMRQKCSSSSCT